MGAGVAAGEATGSMTRTDGEPGGGAIFLIVHDLSGRELSIIYSHLIACWRGDQSTHLLLSSGQEHEVAETPEQIRDQATAVSLSHASALSRVSTRVGVELAREVEAEEVERERAEWRKREAR